MDTKTQQAISLWKSGDEKKAMKIFSSFKLGFTGQEKRILKIAHECLSGQQSFYSQLGINAQGMITQSRIIIENKYNLKP